MDTQEIDQSIKRDRRSTIGDSIRRSKHIFFVEDLPRNAAGKIFKRELREEFAARS